MNIKIYHSNLKHLDDKRLIVADLHSTKGYLGRLALPREDWEEFCLKTPEIPKIEAMEHEHGTFFKFDGFIGYVP
jgi:hypothetical protein